MHREFIGETRMGASIYPETSTGSHLCVLMRIHIFRVHAPNMQLMAIKVLKELFSARYPKFMDEHPTCAGGEAARKWLRGRRRL